MPCCFICLNETLLVENLKKKKTTFAYRLQFGKFGQMIGAHPRIREHSRFLLIPGPDDAGVLN